MSASRVALVTGASAGIGFQTALGLVRAGFCVVITGRNEARMRRSVEALSARAAGTSVSALRADFSSLVAVERLAERFLELHDRLDVLVHNAGVWHPHRQLSEDGYEDTFAVNHLAPFLLTQRLRSALVAAAPARVVTVSSRLHERQRRLEFEALSRERGYRGLHVYAQSKLANVLFANELGRRLEAEGVLSNSLHPGDVATTITRDSEWLSLGMRLASSLLLTPAQGALTSIHCATSDSLADVTGRYFKRCREARPSPAALDREAAARLWQISLEMIESVVGARF